MGKTKEQIAKESDRKVNEILLGGLYLGFIATISFIGGGFIGLFTDAVVLLVLSFYILLAVFVIYTILGTISGLFHYYTETKKLKRKRKND